MVLLAQHYRGFDLVDGEVPAAPDHIAVASALEADFRRGTAFGLARATRGLDLLEELDAIALLPEPVDSLGRNVGIHNDAAAGLLGADDDHPELVPKLGQMTPIASGNGDVEYGHGSASVALRIINVTLGNPERMMAFHSGKVLSRKNVSALSSGLPNNLTYKSWNFSERKIWLNARSTMRRKSASPRSSARAIGA